MVDLKISFKPKENPIGPSKCHKCRYEAVHEHSIPCCLCFAKPYHDFFRDKKLPIHNWNDGKPE